MEFSGIAALSVLLLFSLVYGQSTNVCDEVKAASGNDYMANATHCQCFYRCINGYKYDFVCGPGQMYNNASLNCHHISGSECPQWGYCNANNINKTFPHVCLRRYFLCNGSTFLEMNCSAGQFYNRMSGQCERGDVKEDHMCATVTGNSTTNECHLRPDEFGSHCNYLVTNQNETYRMACPETTGFNKTECGCTTLNVTCPTPTGKTVCKRPDKPCRASFVLSFDHRRDDGTLIAYCEKIDGDLPDHIKADGIEFEDDKAVISMDPSTGEPEFLYIYSFSNNEMAPAIGMILIFKSNGPTTIPIEVVSNNYMDKCTPTLEVTATLVETTYTVELKVTTMTRYSMWNTTLISASISTELTVSDPESYLEISFLIDQTLALKLTDKGPDATETLGTTGVKTGTTIVGTTIAPNMCGLSFFEGLDGIAVTVEIYEGCRNATAFWEE